MTHYHPYPQLVRAHLFLTILAPKDSQLTWPRRWPISAIGSSAWTAQIKRSAAFLQKKPSYLSEINPQSYFLSRFIFRKNPRLLPKSTHSPCLLIGLSFVLLGRPVWNGPKTARETLLL